MAINYQTMKIGILSQEDAAVWVSCAMYWMMVSHWKKYEQLFIYNKYNGE